MNQLKSTLVAGLLLLIVSTVQADVITVYDEGDSGAGTLRNALSIASSGDKIIFAHFYMNILVNNEILIDKDIRIHSYGNVSVSAGGSSNRIFNVTTDGIVSIIGLKLSGGNSDQGGAILNNGSLSMENCVFSGNGTSNEYLASNGGAILNYGSLILNRCELRNNFATAGGAIADYGSLKIYNSHFESNLAAGYDSSMGGAIAIYQNSNSNGRSHIITYTRFIDHTAGDGADGGAIYSNHTSTVKLSYCLFDGNSVVGGSSGRGGAVYGMIKAIGCTFTNNSAQHSSSTGSAFYGWDSKLTNCTFVNNHGNAGGTTNSGGAVAGSDIILYNCTIVGNNSYDNAGGVHGEGEGIEINNCIIAGNVGNPYSPSGYYDISGVISSSKGHNIFSETWGHVIIGNTTGDMILGADTLFNSMEGSLSYNGGFTPTLALFDNSIAIDAGVATGAAPDTDQREFDRDVNVDIGAYEYISTSTTVASTASRVIDNESLVGSSANANVKVYPNPVTNQLTIDLKESSILEIVVVDVHGKQLLLQRFDESAKQASHSIDISHLETGLYYVKVKSSDMKSQQCGIIKQ